MKLMGKRTLISFATHEEALQFDLWEARNTTPTKRMEILANLIELQKKLPKQIVRTDTDNVPTIRRVRP